MIDFYGAKVPGYSEAYFNRENFAENTLKQVSIAKIPPKFDFKDSVTSIRFDEPKQAFAITSKDSGSFHARKVVVGMGAGPHRVPEKITDERDKETKIIAKDKTRARSIMDLDEFMRFSFQYKKATGSKAKMLKGKVIVIHGPNAAIDAVERAMDCGIQAKNLTWLVGITPPKILTPNNLKFAPGLAARAIRIARDSLSIKTVKAKLEVSYQRWSGNDKPIIKNVDYYVYALGQNVAAAGAIGGILDSDLQGNLKPLYDINRRLGNSPYETVLGLEYRPATATGCRLQIIGAAAVAMAKKTKVRHPLDAIKYTKDYIERLLEGFEQSKHHMAVTARTFSNRYIPQDGKEPSYRREIIEKDPDYLQISKWVNEQNDLRSDYVLKRIQHKPVDAGKAVELSNEMLPWDDWLQQVNLLADMTAKPQGPVESNITRQMDNQTKTLPNSVVVAPQLSAIRSAMMALNASMPSFITRDAELVGCDSTQLQVHLMTRVLQDNAEDTLTPAMAAMLVEDFVAFRKQLEGYPYGLKSEQEVRIFDPLPREEA